MTYNERAIEIGAQALEKYETTAWGDLRLTAARAAAKVVTALREHGLVLVEAEAVEEALFLLKGRETDVEDRLRAAFDKTGEAS
jgi:hypothetical protein